MKKFLSHLFGSLTILALTSTLALAKPGWTDDYDKALTQAKTEKKMVILYFADSNSTNYVEANKAVFTQPEFTDYAKKNFVLVELDLNSPEVRSRSRFRYVGDGYTRMETKRIEVKTQSQQATDRIRKLMTEYDVSSPPWVVVLDSEGRKVGSVYISAKITVIQIIDRINGFQRRMNK